VDHLVANFVQPPATGPTIVKRSFLQLLFTEDRTGLSARPSPTSVTDHLAPLRLEVADYQLMIIAHAETLCFLKEANGSPYSVEQPSNQSVNSVNLIIELGKNSKAQRVFE
jgi:hypothetical protein